MAADIPRHAGAPHLPNPRRPPARLCPLPAPPSFGAEDARSGGALTRRVLAPARKPRQPVRASRPRARHEDANRPMVARGQCRSQPRTVHESSGPKPQFCARRCVATQRMGRLARSLVPERPLAPQGPRCDRRPPSAGWNFQARINSAQCNPLRRRLAAAGPSEFHAVTCRNPAHSDMEDGQNLQRLKELQRPETVVATARMDSTNKHAVDHACGLPKVDETPRRACHITDPRRNSPTRIGEANLSLAVARQTSEWRMTGVYEAGSRIRNYLRTDMARGPLGPAK